MYHMRETIQQSGKLGIYSLQDLTVNSVFMLTKKFRPCSSNDSHLSFPLEKNFTKLIVDLNLLILFLFLLICFYVVDINECAPNPCQNGGQCVEQFNATYVCGCAAGYAGVNCTESMLLLF